LRSWWFSRSSNPASPVYIEELAGAALPWPPLKVFGKRFGDSPGLVIGWRTP
jgi:hypothetical protein